MAKIEFETDECFDEKQASKCIFASEVFLKEPDLKFQYHERVINDG